MAHGPNLVCLLFLQMKFYWNSVMLIYAHMSMAVFTLKSQDRLDVTETTGPEKLNLFTTIMEKVY